jgi:hypothetical protein
VSKFLLNLLVQIFKALVNSKIQFLFRKGFFSRFWPSQPIRSPACPAFWPSWPYWPNSAHPSPASSRNQRRHRLGLAPPCLHHPGRQGRPSSRHQSSPSSFTPWPLLPPLSHALTHRDEPKITRSLNTTASPAVTPPSPPRRPSPSPIKGDPTPMPSL